jgi:DUF971 family protein
LNTTEGRLKSGQRLAASTPPRQQAYGLFPLVKEDSTMSSSAVWPTELRLHKDRQTLTVTFETGEIYDLSAEYLRVHSPSAEVQGHSRTERKTVPGKKYVQIIDVQAVGNYAVRLTFDDTHSTGIYSWDYLFDLGRNYQANWRDYVSELAAKGLSREPASGPGG